VEAGGCIYHTSSVSAGSRDSVFMLEDNRLVLVKEKLENGKFG